MFRGFEKIKNNKYIPWILLILINGVLYSLVIIKHPGLTADDFVVFSLIRDNPDNLISFNPSDAFYLFSRPLSYFFMYLDYYFMNLDTYSIKFMSLGYHLILLSVFYLFLDLTAKILNFKANYIFNFVLCLIFSFSEISLDWIMWISNKTELLMFMFYIISLLFVLLFVLKGKIFFLYLYILTFVLSSLCKQTSAHLPFLIILITLASKHHLVRGKYKKVLIASASGIILSILITIIFYNVSFSYQDYYWKKIFSFFGNAYMVLFPYKAESVYWFFLSFKWIAVIIFLILIILILLVKKLRNNIKGLLLIMAILLVSFYPRIIAETDSRTLSIQLLWIILILLYFVYKYFNFRTIGYSILIFLLFFNVVNFIDKYKLNLDITNYRNNQAETFIKKYSDVNNTLVITGVNSFILPYHIHYLKSSSVGRDSLYISPFDYIWNSQSDFNPGNVISSLIKCEKTGDTVTISAMTNKVNIYVDYTNIFYDEYKVLDIGYSEYRGINKITFKLPGKFIEKKYEFIYNDGLGWITL